MNLYLHEFTHLTLSLIIGFIIWKISGNFYAILVALAGGFFIDLDHLTDYLLAFRTKFNLVYFLKGYSFLKTDKIYVLFHSWELVFIFFVLTFQRSNIRTFQPILLSFSFSLFFHLIVDVFINNMKPQSYFLYYRIRNKFELKALVTSDHYQKHLRNKKLIKF